MDIIKINPLDFGAMLQAVDEPEFVLRSDGLIEFPVGGQLYEESFEVPVTSEWGKQVLEDAKHVDLRKG